MTALSSGLLPHQLDVRGTVARDDAQVFGDVNNETINFGNAANRQGSPPYLYQYQQSLTRTLTDVSDEATKACRNELYLTDPHTDRESLISAKGHRARGTCEWIRDNENYQSWLSGSSQLLWILGGPGKGKTMMSIFLTEELERLSK